MNSDFHGLGKSPFCPHLELLQQKARAGDLGRVLFPMASIQGEGGGGGGTCLDLLQLDGRAGEQGVAGDGDGGGGWVLHGSAGGPWELQVRLPLPVKDSP